MHKHSLSHTDEEKKSRPIIWGYESRDWYPLEYLTSRKETSELHIDVIIYIYIYI